ncbi:MAG: DUF1707 SHOCT-like domain-containing protein [Acidimicrobiales bacterium]
MTDHLRVSDAERRLAGELLSRHFVDGRLTQEELDDRIGAAMAARTRADIARLLADLPPASVAPAPVTTPKRGARRLVAAAVALSLVVPAALLTRGHESHPAASFRHPPSAKLLPFVQARGVELRLRLPSQRT